MDRFLRIITPEVKSLAENKRTAEAIYALEETISWSLVQLALIWANNFINLVKAEEYMRTAIKMTPGCWEFHVNLAHVLNLECKFEEARKEAEKAVELSRGSMYEPYYNLGVVLVNLGDHEAAVNAYQSALSLTQDKSCLASYNVSASLLALGRWQEGWAAYESRFKVFEKIKSIHDRFPKHYEKGVPTKDKVIYVYSEQGVGDLIQFARYLPKFKSMTGAKIMLEPQTAIADLMANNFKFDRIVPRKDGEWPQVPSEVDYAISINSLPGLFEAGMKPIPNKPYIKAPVRNDALLKCDKTKVGICWAGNPDHVNDMKRSICLKHFAPLFDLDIQLFSLQKGATGTRNWWGKYVNLMADLPTCNIIDLSPNLSDFNDTAYYISQMDVIITVDTSIAHLAGAMGKPTWLLLDKHNDWRWGISGKTTPWYPTMTIFRQEEAFNWPPVLQEVARQLASCQILEQDQKKSLSCDKKGSSKPRSRKHSP